MKSGKKLSRKHSTIGVNIDANEGHVDTDMVEGHCALLVAEDTWWC